MVPRAIQGLPDASASNRPERDSSPSVVRDMLAGRPCSSPSQTLRASLLADPCCLHATACEKGNHHTCSSPGVYRTNKGTASVTPRQPSRVMLYDDVISSRSGSTKALRELMQLPARKPEAIHPAQNCKNALQTG